MLLFWLSDVRPLSRNLEPNTFQNCVWLWPVAVGHPGIPSVEAVLSATAQTHAIATVLSASAMTHQSTAVPVALAPAQDITAAAVAVPVAVDVAVANAIRLSPY